MTTLDMQVKKIERKRGSNITKKDITGFDGSRFLDQATDFSAYSHLQNAARYDMKVAQLKSYRDLAGRYFNFAENNLNGDTLDKRQDIWMAREFLKEAYRSLFSDDPYYRGSYSRKEKKPERVEQYHPRLGVIQKAYK